MPAVSIMPAVIGLVGTTIGAILGFSGGLFTQLALERRKQEAEKKKKKAEKLEELFSLLYEHFHFFVTNSADNKAMVALVAKIEAIYAVYFSDSLSLDIPITAVLATAYEADIDDNAKRRYTSQLEELTNKLKEYAKREFQ
jgi:hypothetical protein